MTTLFNLRDVPVSVSTLMVAVYVPIGLGSLNLTEISYLLIFFPPFVAENIYASIHPNEERVAFHWRVNQVKIVCQGFIIDPPQETLFCQRWPIKT